MRTRVVAWPLLLGAALLSCSSDDKEPGKDPPTTDPPAQTEPTCDALVPEACGLPFPSDFYSVADASSPTGRRVKFSAAILPHRNGGGVTDPTPWLKSDGFSPGQSPFTFLAGATDVGLPTADTIPGSLQPSSPTLLIEAETGALVPHFAELDASATDPARRVLLLRPAVRLKDATRYIVAVHHVVDGSGNAIAPSPGFRALRDGTDAAEITSRRSHYADLFARLSAAGVDPTDLQIAWDYTTASRANNTSRLLHMRDDALARVGDKGPDYTIDAVTIGSAAYPWARRVDLRMKVPLYLDKPEPGGRLVLGADGAPTAATTAEFGVSVYVPASATPTTPAALVHYGHGVLSSRQEITKSVPAANFANEGNFAFFGVDFIGFSSEDTPYIAQTVNGDIGGMEAVIDRQHQGMINELLAMRMMRGAFWQDEAVRVDGASLLDPSQRYYHGISAGGIFGTTYMTLSTDVERGLLGVPGMPFHLLLNRSTDFVPFISLLRGVYSDPIQIQVVLGLLQMIWDRTEPNGYAPYFSQDRMPGTPAHTALIQLAINDFQVTTLGGHVLARTLGARSLRPVNRSVFGIEEVDAPFTGTGLVEYRFPASPDVPAGNVPSTAASSLDPHAKPFTLEAFRKRSAHFLRTGEVIHTCDGPCDPE